MTSRDARGAARRLPAEVLNAGLFTALTAAAWLLQATRAAGVVAMGFAALAAAAAAATYGVLTVRPWGRAVAELSLASSVVAAAARGFASGWNIGRGAIVVFGLFTLWMLRRPGVRAVFDTRGPFRLRPGPMWGVDLSLLGAVVVPAAFAQLPPLAHVGTVLAWSAVYVLWLRPRIVRRFAPMLARRPGDLSAGQARAFRAALAVRARGEAAAALTLAAGLPPVRSVRILRGLCAMESGGEGVERLVLDAGWVPAPAVAAAALASTPPAALDALLEVRWRLVEDLLADAAEADTFAEEADAALERLTGLAFAPPALVQCGAWWSGARDHQTGRAWLVARLWRAGCLDAAVTAAGDDDVPLALAARLARLLDDAPSPAWIASHADLLVLVPHFAEGHGLLMLDGALLSARCLDTVAARLRGRGDVLDLVWRVRTEIHAALPTGVCEYLAVALTGNDGRAETLDVWWAAERARIGRFDDAFADGLEAAHRADWTRAADAFARASEAWPESVCAAANRAVARVRT